MDGSSIMQSDAVNSPKKSAVVLALLEAAATGNISVPYNEQLFSNFSLGNMLGKGSLGTVHVGHRNSSSLHPSITREEVAIKVLNFPDHPDHKLRRSLLREAAAMAGMRHPHLVATLDCAIRATPNWQQDGEQELEMWIVMEVCDGGTLQAAIQHGMYKAADGSPALDRIFSTAGEICQALEHCHGRSVLHGDLSAANVLLASSQAAASGFTAKVADFGRSRPVSSDESHHTEETGTVNYMPPELMKTGKVTKAADVYAFGVLLWELFTSSLAWAGLRPSVIVFRVSIMHAKLPIPASCPPLLKALMEACMDQEYQQRPSFAAVAVLLAEAAAASLGAPAAAAACPPPLVAPPLCPGQGLP